MKGAVLRPGWVLVAGWLLAACAPQPLPVRDSRPPQLSSYGRALVLPRQILHDGSGLGRYSIELVRQLGAEPAAVDVWIDRGQAANQAQIAHWLLRFGVDPARIHGATTAMDAAPLAPNSFRLWLQRTDVSWQSCPSVVLASDDWLEVGDMMAAARCRDRNNLARMVVDPADLVRPSQLAPIRADQFISGDAAASPKPTKANRSDSSISSDSEPSSGNAVPGG